jgi:catechol 2,3-dioxygenase-like lactoylglutathione lyase family enzyme
MSFAARGGRHPMILSQHDVRATIAVSDIARAREFYEGKLGLTPLEGGPDFVCIYPCGASVLQVYETPHAGKATATTASWTVPDVEALVDELTARGVEFARYDDPAPDEKGIHAQGGHRVAWFEDPDGNTIAVDNGNTDY